MWDMIVLISDHCLSIYFDSLFFFQCSTMANLTSELVLKQKVSIMTR